MPLSTSRPTLARDLLLASAAAALALALEWMLMPWIGAQAAFLVIQPAIIFTAATLGRLPATLVMVIGALNAVLAWSPAGQLMPDKSADPLAIVAYAAIGALLIAYGGRLHLRSNRAERAERRLSLAQDETGVGLFELDYRAGTAYASPALCQILGQPVMDAPMPLQQWLTSLGAGHVDESLRTIQQKVAAGELRYERELCVKLPDGSDHWLLSRIRLDLDAQGQLVASRGATLDITARKQLLTELEAARSQLQQQLDDMGRLHGLSSRLLAMPALDAALHAILEAVGSFHDTRFGLLRLCEPDGASRLAAHTGLPPDALAQLAALDDAPAGASVCSMAAGAAQRIVVEDTELDERLVDLRPLARTLGVRALHSTPLIANADGRVLGVLTVLLSEPGGPSERLLRLTDLCAGQAAALIEREQALSLAREAQARFEVALHSSSVALTILAPVRDPAGRVTDFVWTYANPAAGALIGRPVPELLGQRVLDVLPHAWDEPGSLARYVQVSEAGCTAEFETRTHRPGPLVWMHVILSPLNGSVVVWFADITQRRAHQQALQDADRRKDEFLATLAHELRNPLAPIRHAAAIVRNEAASTAQRDWSLAVIERQLRHMALLLDDLLDVSRITRGTLPLRRVRSALRPIIDSAVETARPQLGARGHELVVDLPDEPVWLDVDPLRIAQVLGNLLVNAAKYTEPGGHVRVGARVEGAELRLSVTDDGIGLQPEDCERVFEMFTQVGVAHGSPQSGLGIGLALARNLVQMHGGQLQASSAGLGRGSTFTARLPVAEAPAGAAPAAELPAPAAPLARAARRRILVADDNRDAADSLVLLLEMAGHDVQVAYDGQEALARYQAFKPQWALLDLGMPGRSGTELARLIRGQPQGEPVTLVAITGFGQDRDREAALNAGFDHHLTKPIAIEELQSLIDGSAVAPGRAPRRQAVLGDSARKAS